MILDHIPQMGQNWATCLHVIVVPDNVSTVKVSTKDHVQGLWNDGKGVIHLADVAHVCNSKCGVGDSNNCCHGERSTLHVVAASLTKY